MALSLSAGCFLTKIVGSTKLPEFALTETLYANGLRLPRHSHEHSCFVFVLQGTFNETFESNSRVCRSQTLIFRPANEKHSDHFHGKGGRCFNIEMDPQWLKRIGTRTVGLNGSSDFHGGILSRLALQIYQEYRHPDEVSSLAIEGLLLEILAEVFRRSTTATVGRERPPWIEHAREMIHANFREPLTLSAVAATVGVHPVHLATVFRRTYRCSMGEYVRRRRVEFACEELSRPDTPLIRIALAAGFYDQGHFCRTFKRLTGITPTAYRRNISRSLIPSEKL